MGGTTLQARCIAGLAICQVYLDTGAPRAHIHFLEVDVTFYLHSPKEETDTRFCMFA
jgi:hypothetical protein